MTPRRRRISADSVVTCAATDVVVGAGFNGPDASAHGGYLCGLLATRVVTDEEETPAVTLLAPPPIATVMELRPGARRAGLWNGDQLVATVAGTRTPMPVLPPVTLSLARTCAEQFLGATDHPFPRCFACGPEREDDGLGLAPGAVPGVADTVACPWTPRARGRIPDEIVWAVLDCPAGWTTDPRPRPRVLTRMTARIRRSPEGGQHYVVVARRQAGHGRTTTDCVNLYSTAGALMATSHAMWTRVDAQALAG